QSCGRDPDPRVAVEHPLVAVPPLSEHVDAPRFRLPIPDPRLAMGCKGRVVQGPDTTVTNDDEVEVPKGVLDRGKLIGSYPDLEVGVLACLMSHEEIQSPSGYDVPGGLDAVEPP